MINRRIDLYNYSKLMQKKINNIMDGDIPSDDKQYLLKFKDYCILKGVTHGKIANYLYYLTLFTKMLRKPIKSATREDISKVITEASAYEWSEYTKKTFKFVVKRLYKIVYGMEDSEDYPDIVRWIRLKVNKRNCLLPEDLLTPRDFDNMIRACKTIRDRALIATLVFSGARVGEIGTMRISQVSIEPLGARLTLHGKTGSRRILVPKCTPYLKDWLAMHPMNCDADACLWIGTNMKPMGYRRISDIIKESAIKAGINKRIYPHLLRHSRATQLANCMNESKLSEYLGWIQGTKMARTYVHMSGRNTDDDILKESGIVNQNFSYVQAPFSPN